MHENERMDEARETLDRISRESARKTIDSLAKAPVRSHNDQMEYVPRPELDAKLETIEARMDGRLARIEDAVKRISDDNAATRSGISNLKTTLIVTAIGAVLTIVLGIAAFNATLTSNMLGAFQMGQQTMPTKAPPSK